MLQEVIRDVDLASRSNGRFFVVFPGTSGQNALVCCKRIMRLFFICVWTANCAEIADTGPDNFVTSEVFLEMAMENMIKTENQRS